MKLVKAVYAEGVDQLSRTGWTLVATHANAQRVIEKKSVTRDAHYVNHTHVPTEYAILQVLANDPMFVFEKDADAATREEQLEHQLAQCDHERCQALGMARQNETDRNAALQKLADAEKLMQPYRESTASLTRARDEARDKLHKLEADLAKARKELGEARWREVIGS